MRERNDGEADPGEAICSKMVALTAKETSGEMEQMNCQERLRTEPVADGWDGTIRSWSGDTGYATDGGRRKTDGQIGEEGRVPGRLSNCEGPSQGHMPSRSYLLSEREELNPPPHCSFRRVRYRGPHMIEHRAQPRVGAEDEMSRIIADMTNHNAGDKQGN